MKMITKTKNSRKPSKAYSYIRFSTPEQVLGDSERRQLEAARAFAARQGLLLDESLKTDIGLSGYRGTNRKKGSLAVFLKMIQDGMVSPGSWLIVENVDRLSREPFIDAFATFSTIVSAGITIQTLSPEVCYDRSALNGGQLFGLVAQMQMAHEESSKKSQRGKANWEQKRRLASEGKMLTKIMPAWLRINDSGKVEPIPEAAKTIKKMFELKSKGIGMRTIVQELNEPGYWKPPAIRRSRPGTTQKTNQPEKGSVGSWRASYLKKVLSNIAVIGEYQPHEMRDGKRVPVGEPMEKYFPAIVSQSLFNQVRKSLNANRGKGGQTGRFSNVLRHLVFCAYCGGSMTYLNKGEPPKNGKYLVCELGHRSDKCDRHKISYAEVEQLVLANCPKLDPSMVLPSDEDSKSKCKSLRTRLAASEAVSAKKSQQIENLVNQISDSDDKSIRKIYEDRLKLLQSESAVADTESRNLAVELSKEERRSEKFAEWTVGLLDLQKAIDADQPNVRSQLNAHLREIIERIEVFSVGYKKLFDSTVELPPSKLSTKMGSKKLSWAESRPSRPPCDSDQVVEWLTSIEDDNFPDAPRNPNFIEFVRQKSMSRDGRFIRVFFGPDKWIDLVPTGSIAFGYELRTVGKKFEWKWVSPSTEELWNEFELDSGR